MTYASSLKVHLRPCYPYPTSSNRTGTDGRQAGLSLGRGPFRSCIQALHRRCFLKPPFPLFLHIAFSRLLGFFCFSLFCWLSSLLPAQLCETRTQSQHISSHVYACRTLTALPRRPRCPRLLQRLRRPPPRVFMRRLHSYQRTIKAVWLLSSLPWPSLLSWSPSLFEAISATPMARGSKMTTSPQPSL